MQGVFQTLGILDATLSILPDWRRALSAFPVVSWPTFVDYIRSRINILATEEHLRELVNQLHFIGEVAFFLHSSVILEKLVLRFEG